MVGPDQSAARPENVGADSDESALSRDVGSQTGGFARVGYLAADHDIDFVGEIKHEIDFVLDEEDIVLSRICSMAAGTSGTTDGAEPSSGSSSKINCCGAHKAREHLSLATAEIFAGAS